MAFESKEISAALAEVEDPEVPITLADLGVLRSVEVTPGTVRVHLAPTRLGCPGREEMARRVEEAVRRAAPDVDVDVVWDMMAWRPGDITERGTEVLADFGYALLSGSMRCPYCRSEAVRSDGNFGGSICKRPYTCRSCGSTFDALRSVFE